MTLTLPVRNIVTNDFIGCLPGYTKDAKTSTAAAVTTTGQSCVITTEALTTAAAAVYSMVVTNAAIAATDIVMASVQYGTCSAGDPHIDRVTPAAGSLTITVKNTHASAALNGTLKISYAVVA